MRKLMAWCGLIIWAGLALLVIASLAAHAADSVCFEAEKGELKDQMKKRFKVSDVSAKVNKEIVKKASEHSYIGVPEDGAKEKEPTKGSATIKFTVPATGDYRVFLRVWWLDSCANSFMLQFDDLPEFKFGNDTTYQTWQWPKFDRKVKLSAGEHTLVIKNVEDGALVDEIFLTTGEVVPQGAMKATQ